MALPTTRELLWFAQNEAEVLSSLDNLNSLSLKTISQNSCYLYLFERRAAFEYPLQGSSFKRDHFRENGNLTTRRITIPIAITANIPGRRQGLFIFTRQIL